MFAGVDRVDDWGANPRLRLGLLRVSTAAAGGGNTRAAKSSSKSTSLTWRFLSELSVQVQVGKALRIVLGSTETLLHPFFACYDIISIAQGIKSQRDVLEAIVLDFVSG